MRKILITGGTVFVSRYIAEYFVFQGDEVYVLNRNTKPQSDGVILIEADRHDLKDRLRDYYFDVVINTAYRPEEIDQLLNALGQYKDYIFISSSAVYPEYALQPFCEETELAENKYWGQYGIDKIEAEKLLQKRNPNAYILRPPYLYGPMNNVYRESFVFDCALADREFYVPKDGEMKLQFFHIHDLCRFIDIILQKHPHRHIYNVGNKELVTVNEWVRLCYDVCHKPAQLIYVNDHISQRNYFSFYDYEYVLDVTKQDELMPEVKSLQEGLKESFEWYLQHSSVVSKKPFFKYIDDHLKR